MVHCDYVRQRVSEPKLLEPLPLFHVEGPPRDWQDPHSGVDDAL